ncbi:MAG: hypothetical protein ACRD2G_09260, partial [Terriglobia bacterium]
MTSKKSHNSGNGRPKLQDRIDRSVGLADQQLGYQSLPAAAATWAPLQPAGIPRAGAPAISAAKGDFEKTYGVSGTPITSGFLIDLGEYNPELMGRNAIPIYEKMRRSDAQVRATLMACKLPVLSAKWEMAPSAQTFIPSLREDDGNFTSREVAKVSSTGAGAETEAKAKE